MKLTTTAILVLILFASLLQLGGQEELLPVPENARPPVKGQAYWWPAVCIDYVPQALKGRDCQEARRWSAMWAQGVDRVGVCDIGPAPQSLDEKAERAARITDIELGLSDDGCVWIRGVSAYWLYWEWPRNAEEGYWVLGGGGVGAAYNGRMIPEMLFMRGGSRTTRRRDFMPDLYLENVKLGWWKQP